MYFQHVTSDLCFYCMINNYNPGQSLNAGRILVALTLHCPFPHYGEKLWTASLCWVYEGCVPRKTKGPSAAGIAIVQCHHSAKLQTVWVLTHSCSIYTAAVAENTGKRGDARDQAGSWKRRWKPERLGERTAGMRLRSCFCAELFDSHLKLEENVCVCVFAWIATWVFVRTRLVIYSHQVF